MELKELKQINNGMIPTEKPTIEEKVASGIGVEGTTGQSTLTDRKYISNLPKYSVGKVVKSINAWGNKDNAMFGSNAGAVMSAAPAAIDFVGSISSGTKYNKTADDLLQDAGSAQGNIGGVSYQTQNEIDESQVAAQEHAENKANTIGLMGKGASLGASIGSVAGPVGGLVGGAVGAIGGLVGGLFGGGKRHAAMRRRVAEAQNRALRQNDFSRNGALTSVLQQNYAREYGDTESQSLYGFKDGKPVQSPFGTMPGKYKNAYGANGEQMIQKGPNGEVLSDQRLGTGMDNKDTVPIYVNNNTEILSNKFGELPNGVKVRPSEYYRQTGDLQGAEYANTNVYMKNKFKNGKLPKFALGLPDILNAATNSIGLITALGDKYKIDKEPVVKHDTYQSNANQAQALYILGQQQENPYAIIPELYNEYAKGMYNLSNTTGLSGGQRALAKLSALNNLNAQSAKLQQASQAANIGHRQTYADAMLRYGAMDAQNRMAALQHDLGLYSQAHGAKTLMSSQRQADAMNYLNNFTKGVNDMYMFNKMYRLYDEDVKTRKKDNANNVIGNTTSAYSSIPYVNKWVPGLSYKYQMNFPSLVNPMAPFTLNFSKTKSSSTNNQKKYRPFER